MKGEWTGIMRALKFLVVAMGVLIVAATAILVAIVVNRAGQLDRGAPAQAERTVPVPEGFRVTATDLSGDRLLVRLEGHAPGAAGDEVRLLVFDLANGASVRTLRLVPPGAASQTGGH